LREIPDPDSEAIDFRVASELLTDVRKLKRRDLETLRLLTSHQGRKMPTVGGVLLFGRDRLTRFPDAGIQAGPFKGIDKGAILDHAELKMPLVQAIGDAVAFVEKHAIHGA
jgi:predicted HTH transcriptional regulator